MNSHADIKKELEEIIKNLEEKNEEALTQTCETLLERATKKLGPGVYVKGQAKGQSGKTWVIQYKRPSIGQREQFVFDHETRQEDPQDENEDDTSSDPDHETRQEDPQDENEDDTSSDPDQDDTGASQDERYDLFVNIIEEIYLSEDDYTSKGFPVLEKINGALPEGETPFTAQERDAFWVRLED